MERKPFVRISKAESGTALLDWLAGRFTYLPHGDWLRMLEEGRVRVDGSEAAASRPLAAGETVAFDPPPFEEPAVDGSFQVLFENEEYLIVDKSGSLPCHPGGRYFAHSLWYLLRERYGGELHIATRLDRETSGLVLVCRSARSAGYAQRMHAEGALKKDYLALVHGRFPESLDAKGYLTDDTASCVRKKRRYIGGGSLPPALGAVACATSFRYVGSINYGLPDSLGGGPISLVYARPYTGRTHQIRATLWSLGYPVVGDKLYGLDEIFFLKFAAGELDEEDLTRLLLPNQALHCSGLSFIDEAGRAVAAESEPRWGPRFCAGGFSSPCEDRRP